MKLQDYLYAKKLQDKRFTKRGFADKLRVSDVYLRSIASCRVIPSIRLAEDIEAATNGNVSVDELMSPEKYQDFSALLKSA